MDGVYHFKQFDNAKEACILEYFICTLFYLDLVPDFYFNFLGVESSTGIHMYRILWI